ncbi:MoxR family ATPase [Bacillota bacterium LX-D]|nr:MoxR family ATPase [Bacillota bacterium LX-D]
MEITLDWLKNAMAETGYISEDEINMAVFLALNLEKPLLITGAPGVGKTELAKVLSKIFQTELIRLQCYEGLDESKALYEWNYQKQLLSIQLGKEQGANKIEQDLFSENYLLPRPLLKALRAEQKPVLLIDEIDKTDEEFEAFLLEILSDFQVSIPELGTVRANQIPIVVLTSNAERELSDGLKRRCIYLNIDYPRIDKELAILNAKVPGIDRRLAQEVAKAVQLVRSLEIQKKPSIAETIDWAKALVLLGAENLTPNLVEKTTNLLLKDKHDVDNFNRDMGSRCLCSKVQGRECNE